MDNNIQSLIKERYNQLPDDIKNAIKNTDFAGKFSAIADRHSLHVDQNGALQTETLLVMLGLEPTEDYVDNIQKELEISRTEAQSIATDVNKEILDNIRTSLRTMQEEAEDAESEKETPPQPPLTPSPTISQTPQTPPPSQSFHPNPAIAHVEKVGNFTVERVKPVVPSQYNDSNLQKEKVLKEIENPKGEVNGFEFVDHLLTKPEGSVAETTEIKKPTEPPMRAKTPAEVPPRKSGIDPYREPVE